MISRFSVKRPYTVVVAVVLVLILGFVSFTSMTTDLLPSMNLPYAMVMTSYPGASPEEVETAVTRPVEQAMATVSNIENVSSVSSENMSMVILEFAQTTDMDSVSLEMKESLDQISGNWDETISSPIIMKMNPEMMPVMVAAVGVSGEKESAEVANIVDKKVIPEIESTEGVASVSSSGMVEESVQVLLRQDKIDKLNNKLKKELDKKFSDAQDKLNTAKSEIKNGKSELDKGSEQAAGQLGDAKSKLNSGKDEMLKGEVQIDQQLSNLQLEEAALSQVEAQLKPQLSVTESQMTAQIKNMENTKKTLESQKKTLEEQLSNPKLPAALRQQLEDQLETLEDGLEELDDQLAQAREGLAGIQAAVKQLSDTYKQIEAGKKTLTQMKDKITAGKLPVEQAMAELDKQQLLATIKMSSAAAQLSLGEAQTKEAETKLKESKDEAYTQADLTKIISADMVKNLLKAQNFSMPAGYVSENGVDYLVRVGEKANDVETFKNMVLVNMEGIDPVRITDVADVSVVNNSDEVYAKINGEPGVLLNIQKQTGYSTGTVAGNINDKFSQVAEQNKNIHITPLMDQGVYIDMVINSVLQNMLFGGILAILVLIFFLRSIKPTLVIACSIPISILTAIVLMYFSGVTINVISLSGLALGVGMLVDNSIVVIENIYRMRGEGRSAKVAAVEGAKQVSGAIAASTLTTVCVFLPIVFAEGITRQLFVDMGLTIAYSLLASLFVALTLVPMMSAGLLEKEQKEEYAVFGKIKNVYGKILGTALKHRFITIGLAVVLLVISGAAAISRGTAFMPEMDSTQMNMKVTTEKGSTLEDTGKISDQVMEEVRKIKDVDSVGAMAGGGSMMSSKSASNEVSIYITLKEDKKRSNEEIKQEILKNTKDIKCELEVSASSMDMSALGQNGIVIQIKGRDLNKLQKTAKDVAGIVKDVKGTTEVNDGMEETTGELRVIVDEEKAMKYNLTKAQVYQQIASKVAEAQSATTLDSDVKDYSVYVEDSKTVDLTRQDIKNMKITSTDAQGKEKEISLSSIVKFENGKGLNSIRRDAQSRYISVTASIKDGYNIGIVADKVEKQLNKYDAPKGYTVEMKGEDETINEAMIQVLKMLALAIVFMYLIMVAQFQSLLSPFIIMFTIPLAFTGGLFGLFFTGKEVSVIAMIGFVMLSGIIVNNGIVFVDYTNQLRREGMEKRDALIEAGKTRLRPIIMTALTTVLGLSTMAGGMGMGADMAQPMAIVTIGGLIYGTLLTLVVVPCIYDILNRKKNMVEEEI